MLLHSLSFIHLTILHLSHSLSGTPGIVVAPKLSSFILPSSCVLLKQPFLLRENQSTCHAATPHLLNMIKYNDKTPDWLVCLFVVFDVVVVHFTMHGWMYYPCIDGIESWHSILNDLSLQCTSTRYVRFRNCVHVHKFACHRCFDFLSSCRSSTFPTTSEQWPNTKIQASDKYPFTDVFGYRMTLVAQRPHCLISSHFFPFLFFL